MRSTTSSVMSALHLAMTLPARPSPPRRTAPLAAALHRLARDRIGPDGHLRPSPPPADAAGPSPAAPPSGYVIGSPIPGSDPAPAVPPPTPAQLDALAGFIAGGRGPGGVLVLTGAGCSTESNVPDYRGPGGAYSTGFKPMTHQAFMASPRNRSRYWARSFAGWDRFSRVAPNAAHAGIAALQACSAAGHVVTQNVDRLHHAAGSPPGRVLELHGTTHEVVCMTCKAVTPREEVQRWLSRLNPGAAEAAAVAAAGGEDERARLLRAGTALPVARDLREAGAGVVRPDGDVEIEQAEFEVAPCPACGGVLKPDVVFFGDSLPKARAERALALAQGASRVLVVGSSLAVWSAFRLVRAAKEAGGGGAAVAIVNVGPTRADDLADLKLELRAGEAMAGAAERLA